LSEVTAMSDKSYRSPDGRLISVESVQEKNEEKINREKLEICQLTSILKDNKQELEFLKEHGSNNRLFLTFRQCFSHIILFF
jgi:hypothetical protein